MSGSKHGGVQDVLEYYDDVTFARDRVCGLAVDSKVVVSPEDFVLF